MGKDYIMLLPATRRCSYGQGSCAPTNSMCGYKTHGVRCLRFGCEDALVHLLNHVWPNIFETSPHLVQAFMDAVEGMRVALGLLKFCSMLYRDIPSSKKSSRCVLEDLQYIYIGGQDALVAFLSKDTK
ncbi:unnamed protein product [Arctia plantaginis]|uniref:Uncharacterized protein n=1 Tax=Arctia plantaginis TaxID=874455 RepID=A0A8S0Z697_ARCPL|nr:unnamed protein product [Arctia plantaginis]